MSDKRETIGLSGEDTTMIAKLLGAKSLEGLKIEAMVSKDERLVVDIKGELRNRPLELRLVRAAGGSFRQSPTTADVRALRKQLEGGTEPGRVDLVTFVRERHLAGLPLDMSDWESGLRRAAAQLRDILRDRVKRLEAYLAPPPAAIEQPVAAE